VRERTCQDDERSLPDGLRTVRPVFIAGGDVVLERVHPRDLHVATGRDRLDPVLDLPATDRPQLRAEPDEVLQDAEAELPGQEVVTELVDQDDREQGDEEGDDGENAHGATVPR